MFSVIGKLPGRNGRSPAIQPGTMFPHDLGQQPADFTPSEGEAARRPPLGMGEPGLASMPARW